jgi:hypothetical protein
MMTALGMASAQWLQYGYLSFTAPCSEPGGNTPRWIGRVGLAEADGLLRGAVNLETDLMGSQLTTLTSADRQRFERDGYVVVRQAFSRADGLAMEQRWWQELEDTRGIRPDDRSSWRSSWAT